MRGRRGIQRNFALLTGGFFRLFPRAPEAFGRGAFSGAESTPPLRIFFVSEWRGGARAPVASASENSRRSVFRPHARRVIKVLTKFAASEVIGAIF
ncbi:MAG: hypothetical protein BHW65_01935 [Verrucomicrobia bacterium CAG:312_58_20]|nr:MAG: hypothetical protein BHW65_01935 [Verrucomicrobia bacterium CAG:312_58_20]